MRQVIPFMTAEIGLPACPLMFATDKEGSNTQDAGCFGIVGAKSEPSTVMRVLTKGTRPGYTVARLDGRIDHLKNMKKELQCRIPISRVPRDVLQGSDLHWKVLAKGRWRFHDHVMLGEGRATLELLERLAGRRGAHAHRVVSLEDNTGWSAATAKGRSPAGSINYLLRKRTALQRATRISLHLPWVDTKSQPADESSRTR